jgi:hypothetical protein
VPAEAQAVAEAIAQCLSRTWDRARLAAHIHSRTWAAVAEECYAQLSQLVRLPAGRGA